MVICYLAIGNSVHTGRWLEFFRDKNHKVYLVTADPGKPIPGVTVYNIRPSKGGKLWKYFSGLLELKNILIKLKPHILHAHYLTGYGFWGMFSRYHPFIVTLWGRDIYVNPERSFLNRWLTTRALKSADLITGDSKDLIKKAIELGACEIKCEVIPWGVELEKFHPLLNDEDKLLSLGIKDNEIVVLSIRNFTEPFYNIDKIIKSIPEVVKKIQNIKFVFLGKGPLIQEMKNLALNLGINNNSLFIGEVNRERVPLFMKRADIYISIPSIDATSMSLLESMAAGLPAIVSDLPSNIEWLENERGGLVVDINDQNSIINSILTLAINQNLRNEYGKYNRRVVEQRADMNSIMNAMEAKYLILAKNFGKL